MIFFMKEFRSRCARLELDNERLRAELAAAKQLQTRLNIALNDYLCEMRPGYADSMVGFNEAWDVMRKVFSSAALATRR